MSDSHDGEEKDLGIPVGMLNDRDKAGEWLPTGQRLLAVR